MRCAPTAVHRSAAVATLAVAPPAPYNPLPTGCPQCQQCPPSAFTSMGQRWLQGAYRGEKTCQGSCRVGGRGLGGACSPGPRTLEFQELKPDSFQPRDKPQVCPGESGERDGSTCQGWSDTCCVPGCGAREDTDTAGMIRHIHSDPDLGSGRGLKKPREEGVIPRGSSFPEERESEPLGCMLLGARAVPNLPGGKLRHRGAASCPRPSRKGLRWQAFEHRSVQLCDHDRPPTAPQRERECRAGWGCAGEGWAQAGGAGAWEGPQAEVWARHPQAGGSCREGLWSWPIWVQTPALPLTSCAALGRSINLSVLSVSHPMKGAQINEAEFWHIMNLMCLLNLKKQTNLKAGRLRQDPVRFGDSLVAGPSARFGPRRWARPGTPRPALPGGRQAWGGRWRSLKPPRGTRQHVRAHGCVAAAASMQTC
ncbi:hypothetical protein HJG60_008922 [Phyllostomus discolor]|uniref:Uncharacterized protein n=1 Tax=Phyllostomus discolor TaxID=89673 RepID=A0A833YZT5_9CHIR|nr:hypothetical protein HJG60_008922 [Phyllostomus discolor]